MSGNIGDRMRGTYEGNIISDKLYSTVRRFGGRVSLTTVTKLVLRGDSYSRTGLTTLGILYDDFFAHMKSLGLPNHFASLESRVAYYCAFREKFPAEKSSNIFADPTGFTFADLKYIQPDMHHDNYANRGPSALLDYLVSTSETEDRE